MAESPTARRRATKVALSLQDLRSAFEQQRLLSVKDTIAIIHEAQDLLNQEANMVMVHGTSTYENDFKMVFLGDYVVSQESVSITRKPRVRDDFVVLWVPQRICPSFLPTLGRLKYGISVYYHFLSCFQSLPIAALLKMPRGDIFCVHGGISPDLSSIYAIDSIDRRRELPTDGPLCDLLWADPAVDAEDGVQDQLNWTMNEAMFAFLEQNRLLAVVRAHEYAEDGYMFHFNSDKYKRLDPREDKSMPPLITVFSAANYCDRHGNLAGYLIIQSEPFQWQMKQIEAVVHPAPPLPGAERGSDIWRQFHQTLPFLPASKDFFEDILTLSRHENVKNEKSVNEIPAFQRMESLKEEAFANIQDPDGERISDEKAEEYLVALDFDHDGVVDFGDILSWTAVMKINYEDLHEPSPWRKVTKGLLRASKAAKIPQLCVLLAMGAIARDMFVGHQRQLIKVKALRIMGYLGLMLYLLKMIGGDHKSVWSVQKQLKNTYNAMLALKSKLALR
ncbi:Serine/threonine-protein phosphatase 2b catalytic subunit, partial [Globisporangium splendens]